jgi:Effector-associated domain 11
VWDKGVLIAVQNCRVEVTETHTDLRGRLDIAIEGDLFDAKKALSSARETFDALNKNWKSQLDEQVPCPCADCRLQNKRFYISTADLMRRLENGVEDKECETKYKRIPIETLLASVMEPNEVIQILSRNEKFRKKFENKSSIIEMIKKSVAKNDFKNVFLQLEVICPPEAKDDLIQIQGNWKAWQQEEIAGTIHHENLVIAQAKMRKSILAFLDDLN